MVDADRWSATNVLVIGAGAGGLRTAIELAERGFDMTCVAKRRKEDAHVVLAAGGINAALATVDPQDTWAQHAADTLREGYLLGDPAAAEELAKGAPGAIEELERWGAGFARQDDGRLTQRFFGAHRWRRTCFAGDYTGLAIHRALRARAGELGVPVRDDVYITRLLVTDGRVFGAYGFDIVTGERQVLLADAVVLSAGGHTGTWHRSTARRDENTGDAMRLASLAGIALQDMEQVQFHPTGMVFPDEVVGTLVTEAVRGEGGLLRNADGERFMTRYDPDRAELSSRDLVAYANHAEIEAGRGSEHGGVWLDVSQLGRDHVLDRLPRMYRQFLDIAGVDMTQEPVQVAPTAHYSMGGARVDPLSHMTAVAGLYAVGESAAGLHGANRLGGNSLAECVVFGRTVGEHAAGYVAGLDRPVRDPDAIAAARDEVDDVLAGDGDDFPRPLQKALRDTMSRRGGVVRDDEGLRHGLVELDAIEDRAKRMRVTPDLAGYQDLTHAFDLHASLLSARATLDCALARTETRGAQMRSDHPDLDPAQQHNLLWSPGRIDTAPVAEPSDEVRDEMRDEEPGTEGRLTE